MRIKHWCLAFAAGALAAAAHAPASAQEIKGTTIRVSTWGGAWRDLVDKNVGAQVKAKGVTVEYMVGNPAEAVAKLVAARGAEPPFEVMEATPDVIDALVGGKLIQDLDLAKIPNAKLLPKFAVAADRVMYATSQDGIVYDAKKFEELGIAKPKSYRDLANPKLAGRVAFPDVGHVEHWNSVVGLAYDAGGEETKMEPVINIVTKEIKPAYYFVSSPALGQKFQSGEIWAAAWHAGWVVRLNRQGMNLAFSHPQMGKKLGALLPQYLFVPKGAKNLAAVHAFIDAYVEPNSQFEHGKAAGFVPVNSDARKKMMNDPDNPMAKQLLLLEDKDFNGAHVIDWAKLDAPKWRDMWSKRPSH